MDKRWFLLFALLAVTGYFAFTGFRSANVVLNYEENYNLNDNLAGNLIITIEKGDSLDVNMPILISLGKGEEIISSETMTLKQFIKLSGSRLVAVENNYNEYYETPGRYNVPLSDVINHKFNEKGEYELIFSLPELDIIKITKITVI
jgi:hypothetical protein